MFSHWKVLITLSSQVLLTDKLAGFCSGLCFTVNWGERNEFHQELANESPWIKSSPSPIFVWPIAKNNFYIFKWLGEIKSRIFGPLKIILEQIHAYYFLTKIYCCIHATIEETSGCNRDNKAIQTKLFTPWLFTEKVCLPLYFINMHISFFTFYSSVLSPSLSNFYFCLDFWLWCVFQDRVRSLGIRAQLWVWQCALNILASLSCKMLRST